MSRDLARYDAACRAIALAKSTNEAAKIRDEGEAMRVCARIAKNRALEIDGAEIRLRAERRIGELIKAQRATFGLAKAGRPTKKIGGFNPPISKPATLAEAGIDKDLAKRARKLSVLSLKAFERQIHEWRDRSAAADRVTLDLYRELRRRQVKSVLDRIRRQRTQRIDGLYDVIVVDPPWPIEKIERDVRPNQVELDYPQMSEDSLRALTIPCAEDAHVWLWTTQRFLPTAFELLEAWQLAYVCTFVWHKPGGFQPIGLPQYNCEFALYARRGSPRFVDTKAFATCFEAARSGHSVKPDEFYDVVRRVTAGRRLDMFNRREIPGFDRWGLEAA